MSIDTAESGTPLATDASPPPDAAAPGDTGSPGRDEITDVAEEPLEDRNEADGSGDSSGDPEDSPEDLESSDGEEEPWNSGADEGDGARQLVDADDAEERLGTDEPNEPVDDPAEASDWAADRTDTEPSGVDEAEPAVVDNPPVDDDESEGTEDAAPSVSDEPESTVDERDLDADPVAQHAGDPDAGDPGAGQETAEPPAPGDEVGGADSEPPAAVDGAADRAADPQTPDGPDEVPGQEEVPDTQPRDADDDTRSVEPADSAGPDVREPHPPGAESVRIAEPALTDTPSAPPEGTLSRTLSLLDEVLNTQQGADVVGLIDREVFGNADAILRHQLQEGAHLRTADGIPESPLLDPAQKAPIAMRAGGATLEGPTSPTAETESPPGSTLEGEQDAIPQEAGSGITMMDNRDEPPPHEPRPSSSEEPPPPDRPEPGAAPEGGGGGPRRPDGPIRPDAHGLPFRTRAEWRESLHDRFDASRSETSTDSSWNEAREFLAEKIEEAHPHMVGKEAGSATADVGQTLEKQADAVSKEISQDVSTIGDTAEGVPDPGDLAEVTTKIIADAAENPEVVEKLGRLVGSVGKVVHDGSDLPAAATVGTAAVIAAALAANHPDVYHAYLSNTASDFLDYFSHLGYRGRHRG